MRYELKDLRLFLAIVQAQNLSTGAERMHMTASSASYRLKNLEYTVGGALFLRTPKGMIPTAAGEVLTKHAKKLLAEVETMHAELSHYASHLRGSIRLLANSSALNSFIIPSVTRFLTSNAGIDIDLKEKESLTISHAIVEGQADIGVGADLEQLPGLTRELYAIDRLVCAVSADHPLANTKVVSFENVLAYDLVSMDRSSSNYHFLANHARLAGIPMKTRMHVHNFSSILYMVEAGVGAAIVPASVLEEAERTRRVVAIPMADSWATRHLYLVRAGASEQNGLVREFAQILLNDPQIVAARAGQHY